MFKTCCRHRCDTAREEEEGLGPWSGTINMWTDSGVILGAILFASEFSDPDAVQSQQPNNDSGMFWKRNVSSRSSDPWALPFAAHGFAQVAAGYPIPRLNARRGQRQRVENLISFLVPLR